MKMGRFFSVTVLDCQRKISKPFHPFHLLLTAHHSGFEMSLESSTKPRPEREISEFLLGPKTIEPSLPPRQRPRRGTQPKHVVTPLVKGQNCTVGTERITSSPHRRASRSFPLALCQFASNCYEILVSCVRSTKQYQV